jgi:hypothetical protein
LHKGEFISSFNYDEVIDEEGIKDDFLSLETDIRLGLYDKFFVYIEVGCNGICYKVRNSVYNKLSIYII